MFDSTSTVPSGEQAAGSTNPFSPHYQVKTQGQVQGNPEVPNKDDLDFRKDVKFDTPPMFVTENGDEYLTIKDAAFLTGVSRKSIERYWNDLVSSPSPEVRNAIRRAQNSWGGPERRILRSYVVHRFAKIMRERFGPDGSAGAQETSEKAKPTAMEKDLIELNKRMIETLERERDQLAGQVSEKDKQIGQLHNLLNAKEIAMARLQGMELLPDGSVKRLGFWSRFRKQK